MITISETKSASLAVVVVENDSCLCCQSLGMARSSRYCSSNFFGSSPCSAIVANCYLAVSPFSVISRRTFASSYPLRANDSLNDGGSQSSLQDSLKSSNASTSGTKASAAAKITPRAPVIKSGSLASGSIFADEEEDLPKYTTEGRAPKRPQAPESTSTSKTEAPSLNERDRSHIDNALNPYPGRRSRWQRKMVIQSIKRRGELTKTEQILRTERESVTKSHWFKTSVKKLVKLTHQIAGKNIDDAILQMRFSKKKAAKDVKDLLEQAKNEAIVARGMGLGKAQAQLDAQEGVDVKPFEPLTIRLKNKSYKTINDPTAIYISQAWVNRGPYGRDYDHRARGQVNILRLPYTGMSVVLKEEKTRIREWKDREEKERMERRSWLWTQLPDRKIYGQNQYYSW